MTSQLHLRDFIAVWNYLLSCTYTTSTRTSAKPGFFGVICGHTHNPEITQLNNVWYCNTGDWVESCCALTEDAKGHLELIHYTGRRLTTAQNSKYESHLSATTDLRDGAYTNANIP